MNSLQDVVNRLLIFHAKALHAQGIRSSDDLYEAAVAKTMDATLAAAWRRLGTQHAHTADGHSIQLDGELNEALAHIDEACSMAAQLGTAFETIRGMRVELGSDGRFELESSSERRSKGIYFTSSALAEALVHPTLERVLARVDEPEQLAGITILDPAVGCGAFLLAVVRIGAQLLAQRRGFQGMTSAEIRAQLAGQCVFGTDIDPVAVATTRALLRAEVNLPDWNPQQLDHHLHVADSISAPLASWREWFPSAFPAGFSAVVTNPPWSKLRPLRHEFFEHMDKRVRLYQGTELGRYLEEHLADLVNGPWQRYTATTVELSRTLRESSEYELNQSSSGDTDLYKYFVERSLALLADNGVAALLLPSGVLRAQGSAELRRLLRERGNVIQLVEYLNRNKLFDIHAMYRFCTVLFDKGTPGGIGKATFSKLNIGHDDTESVELNLNFLAAVGGPHLLVPEVRSAAERDILWRAFRRYPTAGQEGSSWQFSFKRELDMTNDADAFISVTQALQEGYVADTDGCWRAPELGTALLPLYEGRMVHQYDPMAKVYLSGQGRGAAWKVPSIEERRIMPHYLVPKDYAVKRGWSGVERVGYCEISGHANERTLLASLLPPNCVCGNKVPILRLSNGGPEDELLWLALANSLVVDWIMRRFVSTTVNHFYWQNIPLPTRDVHSAVQVLVIKAVRMLSKPVKQESDTLKWLGQRSLLRALIDAAILRMYGFGEAELKVILHDFPKLRKAHQRGHAGSIPIATLIAKADQILLEEDLNLDEIARSFSCKVEDAAAAYTQNEQARILLKR